MKSWSNSVVRWAACAGACFAATLAGSDSARADTVTWTPGWRSGDFWIVRSDYWRLDYETYERVDVGWVELRFVVEDDAVESGEPEVLVTVRARVIADPPYDRSKVVLPEDLFPDLFPEPSSTPAAPSDPFETDGSIGYLWFDALSLRMKGTGRRDLNWDTEPDAAPRRRTSDLSSGGSVNMDVAGLGLRGGRLMWPILRPGPTPGTVTLSDETVTVPAREPGGEPVVSMRQRVTRGEGQTLVEWWYGPDALDEDPAKREQYAMRFRDGLPFPDVLDADGTVDTEVVATGRMPTRERPKLPPGTPVFLPRSRSNMIGDGSAFLARPEE